MTTQPSQRSLRSFSSIRRYAVWAVFALAGTAPGITLAAPALSIAFDPALATSYTPGESVQVTVLLSNGSGTGVDPAATAGVTLTLPAGVTVTSRSCDSTGSGSLCGTAATGTGGGLYSNGSIAVGGNLKITATLQFALAATGNKQITATGSATGVTAVTDVHDFTRIPVTDLAVSATAVAIAQAEIVGDCPGNATTYTPGCASRYTVVVDNNGPDGANGARLSISRTEGATGGISWTCSASGSAACPAASGSGALNNYQIATFPDGGKLTYTVTVTHATTDLHAEAGISASIALPGTPANMVDRNTGNNSRSSDPRSRNAAANLSATVTATTIATPQGHCPGGTGIYTPGCAATYTVEIANAGPDTAHGATLTTLARSEAASAAFAWTCAATGGAVCPATSGTAVLSSVAIGTFPKDGRLIYTVTVTHAASELHASAGITARVTAPANRIDIATGNNQSSASRSIARRAALRVLKRAVQNGNPVTQVSANQAFDYEISVFNAGPSDVGNSGSDPAHPQIDPTGPALVLTDAFDALLEGVGIVGGCSPSGGKPCWTLCPSTLGWQGAGDGQIVADAANCPVDVVTGSAAQLSARFALRAGSGSRLLTRVNVPDVAVATDVLNKAAISVSSCGSLPDCHGIARIEAAEGDDESEATVTIAPAAAVAVDVANLGDGSAIPGTPHSYTITVRNTGFFNLPGASIQSSFPLTDAAGFVPGMVSYQCRAYDGACCFSGGSCGTTEATPAVSANALSATSNLPQNSRVEFTVTGMLDPRATDPVQLQAQVQIGGGVTVQGSATTTLRPEYSLTLSKRLYQRSDAERTSTLFYEITATNNGPSHAPGAQLRDGDATVPTPDFNFDDATWSCEALAAPAAIVAPEATACGRLSGQGGIGDTAQGALPLDLMPGGRAVVRMQVDTTEDAADQVTNIATLSSGAGSLEARATTSLRANYVLEVTKDDGLDVAHPGAAHAYSITVLNKGPDDAYDVHVQDAMPAALSNVQWTCSAISPVPGELARLQDTVDPPQRPGQALTLSADGRHVYVLGRNGDTTPRPTLWAYSRNATPGLNYGAVAFEPFDIEAEGVDDSSDSGSAVAGMADPIDLTLSPDGATLYVLSAASQSIVTFHRVAGVPDPEFGKLSYAGVTPVSMAHPRRIVATATHVYVAGSLTPAGTGQVEVFRPDAGSRRPVAVAGANVAAPAAAGPMVVNASASALFVASTTTSSITRYAIGPAGPNAGRLTQDAVSGANESGFLGIGDMVLAGNGRDLYVHAANAGSPRIGHVGSGSVALSFGALYGQNSAALLGGAVRLALSPDGEHLIGVSPSAHAMFSLRRNPITGALSGSPTGNPDVEQQIFRDGAGGAVGLDVPMALAVSPDNRHVLVASGSTGGAIGPLTVLSRRAPAPQLGFIELDRQGDAIPGTQDAIDSLVAPTDVATRGRFVYVLSRETGAVSLFERRLGHIGPEDEDGSHLTFQQTWRNGQGGVSGMIEPDRLLLSPDGKSLFVSSRDRDSLAVFARDESDGSLAFVRAFQRNGGYPGLLGAYGMAMDGASQHLYVAGSFEERIAIFAHNPDSPQRLSYVGAVVNGQNGVTGLGGIRDLAVAGEGSRSQLLGVSEVANAVVVFNRQSNGTLAFVHALTLAGSNPRPLALALSPNIDSSDNAHVYVAAQNTHTLHVLQRVLDSTDPQFGRVRPVTQVVAGGLAPSRMTGPRDVSVSANGKRVYVAAEFGHSLVAFDRYDNAGSALYGHLALAEIRSQNVDAVGGISAPYAVAVSGDSRNVYVAGFGSDAVASFSVGTGSSCSASGSGDIDDRVTIRAGGAVLYSVQSSIRPDASGTLENTASASGESVVATDADSTALLTSARLELSKTNHQLAVVPGAVVDYDIVIRNAGPGNVVGLDDPSAASVTDLFGCSDDGMGGHDCSASPFDIPSISWTCAASGSGALDFLAAYRDGEQGVSGLTGISSLALIPAGTSGDGTRVRGHFLVGASVDDDALVFFRRDAATGALSPYARIDHSAAAPLEGARSVTLSQDGRLLFVASRRSDSLTVFGLSGSAATPLIVTPLAKAQDPAIKGLDQALHVIALPAADGVEHVYVAGANDHAVAAFAYDRASPNALQHRGSWINGVVADGVAVQGLTDVEYLVASPDGAQVYALSGSGGSVAQFNRNAGTGQLTYVARFTFGSTLAGASSGSFDAAGKYLYLTASGANRLVVLSRVVTAGAGNFGSLSQVPGGVLTQGEGGVQGLLNPRRSVLSADGQHLYVTSQAGATVAWFSLHPQSGVPSYQGIRSNQSAGVEGLAGATGLVLDPQRNQLYIAGTLDRAIAHFQRQSDSWCPPNGSGLLDAVPVNIAAGGQVAFRISVRVSSQLQGNLVNRATVDWQSASCSGEAGTGSGPCSQAGQDEDVPSNLADLSITKDDGLAEFDGLAGAASLAADLRNVYVAAPGDNGIGMFQRYAGAATGIGLRYLGALRSGASGVSGLAGVVDVRASADGQHVYAASPVDNAVASFVRDAGTGRLSQIDMDQNGLLGVAGLSGARALALSPDGEHVYVAGGFSNAVAVFRRQTNPALPAFGTLQYQPLALVQAGIGGVNGIESPLALTLSADGKHLYVLGGAGDTVVAFSRQTNPGSNNFGHLTQIGRYQNASGGVLGMDEVRSLALSAEGAHLYVLGAEAGALVHFSRNAGNGELTFVPHATGQAVYFAPELVGATRLRSGGGRLYAASAAQAVIAVFGIDPDGKPTLEHLVRNGDTPADPGIGLVDGLAGVADVAFINDGGQQGLYAGGAQDAALSAFALVDGEPGYLGAIFDGMGGVAPGDPVTYTLVVSNHGPSDVLRARVVDSFPPEFDQVSWTCSGYAGGECSGSGTGNLDLEVKLPNGGHVQFQATGIVGAKAMGRLVNTATVVAVTSGGGSVLDPDMSNNSATDDDTVLSPQMDVSIRVDDNDDCDTGAPGCEEITQATPGGDIAYRVLAANAGPTYAQGALVSDTLPAALYGVSWTCTPTPQAGLLEEVARVQADYDIAYRAVTVDTLGRHVYAVGTRSDAGVVRDTVVAFVRDPLTGTLTRLRSWSDGEIAPLPDGSGNAPAVRGIRGGIAIAITADGRFVYVAGHDADAIAVFARDPASGLLAWRSQVVNGEFGTSGIGGVSALALAPDGRHLYAGGASGNAIAGFAIHAGTGALTQVAVIRQSDAGVNGLNGVNALAFDAGGSLLFATAGSNRSVTAFRRTIANGALSYAAGIEDGQVGVSASLLLPSALAVHADRVFVADAQGDAVNLLRFVDGDAPHFVLEEIIALDDAAPAGQQPVALAFVPDQARLYVAAKAGAQLHLYSLLDPAAVRHLASYGVATSAALDQVAAIALAPNGRQLYAATSGAGLIATLAREPGSRCPLAGEGGLGSQRVDIAPGGFVRFDVTGRIFANATGTLTYAVGADPRVPAFESHAFDNRASDIDTLVPAPDLETRKLRNTPDAQVIAGLGVSYRIETDNHGVSDALDARMNDALPIFPGTAAGLVAGSAAWGCAANLPLAVAGGLSTGADSRVADLSALAHSPDGRQWFGVSRSGNALVRLRLGAGGEIEEVHRLVDGDDAGGTAISGLAGASHLALSPDGAYLYVTAAGSNSLLVFAIAADGLHVVQKLTSGSNGVAGLQGAAFVQVSGDGRFVYTAAVPGNANNSAIALFRRDADTGELSFVERIQDGLGTFQPHSNVIRGVHRLHLTADGRHLYAVSTVSQSLARFEVDAASGVLRFVDVLRGTGTGALAALAGVRDMVVTPGDTQLYLLGNQGIALFSRALNGSLTHIGNWGAAGTATARALAMDTWGARLYLADAEGAVHLYARQWSDGALERRFSLPAASVADSGALLHLPPLGELLLAQAGAGGGLARLAEQPVSRCMQATGGAAQLPVPVDLGVGGWSRLDLSATVHPSARGILRNVASTVPGSGADPDPGNDEGIDEATIRVVSDLAIEKTGPADAVAGDYVEYVIRVTNAGPSNALGIAVMDDLDPAKFADASWTCVTAGGGGSSCRAASGTGAPLAAVADLHVDDVLTVRLRVQVHPAFLGTLENAAYVVPEAHAVDPTPDDHTAAPVVTQVVRRPDLSVTKTNGVDEVVAGLPVSYGIAVTNLGPSDAPEARVRDVLPSHLRDAGWTCTAQQGTGDCGAASGQGSIDRVVSIPAGETLRWQLDATVHPSALGELANTATAQVLGDAVDPVPGNDSATDTDAIVARADLAPAVAAPAAYDPASAQPMPYRIDVHNAGPSDAAPAMVTIQFNHAVAHATPACTPAQGIQIACSIEAIAAGARATVALGLRALPNAPATLSSSLSVVPQTPDPVPGNNTVTSTTQLRTGVDLEVSIDDGRIGIAPGDVTRYTIRVRNIGSVDAVDARVQVPIATGLVDATWQCSAPGNAACAASGSGDIDDPIALPAGATLTYTLDARLDPAIDLLSHHAVEQTAQAQTDSGQTEVDTGNNADSDVNLIFKVIFRDGFEDEPETQGVRGEPQAMRVPLHTLPLPDAALPSLPARASVRRALHQGAWA